METKESSQSRKYTPKTNNLNSTFEETDIPDPKQEKLFPEWDKNGAEKIGPAGLKAEGGPVKMGPENIPSGSRQLLEQVPIEDTPFTAVKLDDKWFLTLGKYRLSEVMPSLEMVKEDAKDASWNRIMQIILIMIKENEQQKIDTLKTN